MSIRLVVLLLCLLFSCSAPTPLAIPNDDVDLVVIKAVRLPNGEPWYSQFADHCWIDLHQAGKQNWTRVEANTDPEIWDVAPEGAFDLQRWDRPVEILAIQTGADAARSIPLILQQAKTVAQDFEYRAFPGPNSNTYVARILNQVPGLNAELTHNSVGKDYTSSVSAGWTQAGDGLRLDVPMLGASLGWQQGIELHLIGLTAGISFWPPALKLPILPRIGFEPGQTRTP
jgi:hypothetical protein